MTDTPTQSPPHSTGTEKARKQQPYEEPYTLAPILNGVLMPPPVLESFRRSEAAIARWQHEAPNDPALKKTKETLEWEAKQYAKVQGEIQELSKKAGIEEPDLYIKQDAVPNAMAVSVANKKAIVFTTGELQALDGPGETKGVAAHEVGHHSAEETPMQRLAYILQHMRYDLGLGPNPQQAKELGADRKAIELTCEHDGSNLQAIKSAFTNEAAQYRRVETQDSNYRDSLYQEMAAQENRRREEYKKWKPESPLDLRDPGTLVDIAEKIRISLTPNATPESMERWETSAYPSTDARIHAMEEAYQHYCAPLPTPPKEKAADGPLPKK